MVLKSLNLRQQLYELSFLWDIASRTLCLFMGQPETHFCTVLDSEDAGEKPPLVAAAQVREDPYRDFG